MNLGQLFAWLFGYQASDQVTNWSLNLAAPWVQGRLWLPLALCIALAAFTWWIYRYRQRITQLWLRVSLATLRSLILCLLMLLLAEPVLELELSRTLKPLMWVLLDGSASMTMTDGVSADQSSAATGAGERSTGGASREQLVRDWLTRAEPNPIKLLEERYRVAVFAMRGEGVAEPIWAADEEKPFDLAEWTTASAKWKPDSPVTALGRTYEDLARRSAGERLAGIITISDFDQNAGPPAVAAAERLKAPVFAIGVGPQSAPDLSVDLLAPPTMKQGESSTVTVTLRQRELEGALAKLTVTAQWTDRVASADRVAASELPAVKVYAQSVAMASTTQTVEVPFIPDRSGQVVFTASVEPAAGESVTLNNSADREVKVIDDFLRLVYVEYEPTWEWRFIKEVFHRDPLVGMRGFRTFLRSADPVVRDTNSLFLPSLTPPRSEFFKSDVIFLGDMPASAITSRFCELTKEFVGQFGGGLVVLAGPRFGPGELMDTPLADMLPITIDSPVSRRDGEFKPKLSPLAGQFDFMRLGNAQEDSQTAWGNLGSLAWYQPVSRVESRTTTILAQHPTDLCSDGKTPQPLIAIRKYGRGEVVYVAFNEMWRLRRLKGEEYYRQFWGQLIHRLGLSHAIGASKRFVVRTDQQQYRSDDDPLVTVEAFTSDYLPLDADAQAIREIEAELIKNDFGSRGDSTPIKLLQLKPGLYETRLGQLTGGTYRLSVLDPIAKQREEISFVVSDVSAEMRTAVRNVALERSLAAATNGLATPLETADSLLQGLSPKPVTESRRVMIPLWSTWLAFGLVIAGLLVEWAWRKKVHLP